MTLNGVIAVTLRYFNEFGKPVFQHVTASICIGTQNTQNMQNTQKNALQNTIDSCMHESIVFCSAYVRCRRYESSRSLSHRLMSTFSCLLSSYRVPLPHRNLHSLLLRGNGHDRLQF